MFVMDCSVTMAWLFNDERSAYTERLLDKLALDSSAMVPTLWAYEVMNVLWTAEQRKRITPAQSLQFWELLQTINIQVDTHLLLQTAPSILFLARSYKLSAYDAAYLDLAVRQGLPLATLDKQLIKAAKNCGVSLAD